jgi:tyrosyl-tRNA synthetase
MSVSDELMAQYYLLLLGRRFSTELHPMEAKKHLAFEIVATYHSREVAQRTLDNFNRRFSEKRLDGSDLPPFSPPNERDAVSIVVAAYANGFGITKSRAEARRLIEQGSVQLRGEKIRDVNAELSLHSGEILRLDKTRAVRVK